MRKLLLIAVTLLAVVGMYCYIFNLSVQGDAVIGHQDDGIEPITKDVVTAAMPKTM